MWKHFGIFMSFNFPKNEKGVIIIIVYWCRSLEKEDVIPGIKRIKNKRKGIAAVKQCFSWDMRYLEKEKTPIEITKKLTGEQAVCLVLVCLMLEVDVVAFLSNPQDLLEA